MLYRIVGTVTVDVVVIIITGCVTFIKIKNLLRKERKEVEDADEKKEKKEKDKDEGKEEEEKAAEEEKRKEKNFKLP